MSNVRPQKTSMVQPLTFQLITSSVEEGLDFAASLLTGGVQSQVEANPESGTRFANTLASYLRLRYVGELGLALEELVALAHWCKAGGFRDEQFWAQVNWVAERLGHPPVDVPSSASA
jgi:hypothetical protein